MTLAIRAGVFSVVVHGVALFVLSRDVARPSTPRPTPVELELTFRAPVARRTPVPPPPPVRPQTATPPRGPRRSLLAAHPPRVLPAVDAVPAAVEGQLGPPSEGSQDAGLAEAGSEDDGTGTSMPAAPLPPSEPRLLSLPRIDYPPRALLDELEGVVRLEVVLGADGLVREVTVLEAPSSELASAAQAALRAARFHPATRDGQPVETRFSYRYRFELR